MIRVKVASHGAKRNSPNLIMYYTDPVTERRVCRSTGTANRREAERAAAKWEAELQEGRYAPADKITWQEFRERYEAEKLAALAERTGDAAASALNHLERVKAPKRLSGITSGLLSDFQAKLRREGMRETTIDAHLGHLQAALSWAVSVGLLAKLPNMHRPKRVKGRRLMRGRPVTTEEFERMIDAAAKVRPHDAPLWRRYLTGLWLSGLRLEESLALSWEPDAPLAVDLSGRHPRFRIYAEAEKGHKDRYLPMTPDFAEFLLKTPPEDRNGAVFGVVGLKTGRPMSLKRVSRTISRIGRKAGVVTNKPEGRCATAHDLRRSFGTRWAPRVKPATLQLLMRQASIETTLKYYVAQDADDVADELWRAHPAAGAPTLLPTRTRKWGPQGVGTPADETAVSDLTERT
jgi:integrase